MRLLLIVEGRDVAGSNLLELNFFGEVHILRLRL